MPRILLPLLLCLSLIASAVGAAWSATAMAVPMQAMAMDAGNDMHGCCHGQAQDTAPCHDDGADKAPAACADAGHCDCTQHGNMLPAATLLRTAPMRHAMASMPPPSSHDDVSPGQLNRPPIG